MEERDKKEERNKRIGWLTSVGVQLVLLVLFYFIVAWKEPFPPIPEYGIELGFSTSAGAPAAAAPSQESESEENEVVEEEQTEQEQVQESSVEEIVPEEVAVQEETVSEDPQFEPVESDTPVEVEQASTTNEAIEEVLEEPVNETQDSEVEEETVDSRAVMGANEAEVSNENQSDGESENEEEKALDQRAIYGSQGSNTGDSEGANLSLSGWVWDFRPKPNDTSDESGKIVYKIVVDGDGYLVKIETVTSTVSPAVERKYRQEVEKLTFSKTADYQSAAVSTGTITFIIKSR